MYTLFRMRVSMFFKKHSQCVKLFTETLSERTETCTPFGENSNIFYEKMLPKCSAGNYDT